MFPSIRLLIPVLATLALAACGSSSSPSGTTNNSINPSAGTATTGKVTVLLTDGPGHNWDQAIATITSIELLGDDRRELLFEGSSTVDLLSLPDYYDVFSITDNIVPGTFSKIRLHVDSLRLVQLDEFGAEINSIMAQLVGGGKIDLSPRGDIVIGPGDSLYVEVDFDMNKAFKTTTTGNGRVIVRPVVRVRITPAPPLGRLTRLQGTIEAIDATAPEFTLCQNQLVSRMHDDDGESDDDADHVYCIDVATDEATGVFGMDGMPVEFAALEVGDLVTAIGHLQRDDSDDGDDDDMKDGDDDSDGGESEVDDHDADRRHSEKDIILSAVVVEVGENFSRVAGIADGALSGDVFDLAIDPGQNLGTDDSVLSTRVFPATRIFRKDGEELDGMAIAPGVRVLADGVLVPVADMADSLRAALLILDPDFEITEEVVRGEIISVNYDAGILQIRVGEAEQCVNANSADIFLVSNTDGLVTERAGLGDLAPMQSADAFGEGQDEAGCFLATDILASALPNTIPVAAAGDDLEVTAGDSAMLDGSASIDDDSDPLSFQWSFDSVPEGSAAELSSADTATPSFVTDVAGDYVVELIVNDGKEDSAPDTVTITATP